MHCQVWAAEVNFFHGERRCGVVVYLTPPEARSPEVESPEVRSHEVRSPEVRSPEVRSPEGDAEAPRAPPATARVVAAVRRPVRAARLSEEPGGCSGARIGSAARVGPTTSLVGRVDAAAAAAAAPAAAPAAAASEAGGSGGLATHTQHPSASFMAMSFRKVPPTPNPHP